MNPKRPIAALLLFGVIACDGGVSDPQPATAPSLLITNNLLYDRVYVAWNGADGQLLFKDSVGPGLSRRCVHLQPVATDSAQWRLTASEMVDGVRLTSFATSYWFHVGDLRAFEIVVLSTSAQRQSPTIVLWDSAMAANGPVDGRTRETPPHC